MRNCEKSFGAVTLSTQNGASVCLRFRKWMWLRWWWLWWLVWPDWMIFESSWRQNFYQKSQNDWQLLGDFWKTSLLSKNCCCHFWGNFGNIWATFYSNIWSHWWLWWWWLWRRLVKRNYFLVMDFSQIIRRSRFLPLCTLAYLIALNKGSHRYWRHLLGHLRWRGLSLRTVLCCALCPLLRLYTDPMFRFAPLRYLLIFFQFSGLFGKKICH